MPVSHDGTPPGCSMHLICCFSLRPDDEVEKAVYPRPIVGQPSLSIFVFEKEFSWETYNLPTLICLPEINGYHKLQMQDVF